MNRAVLLLTVVSTVLAGCSSKSHEPELLGSTTFEGRGYPHGSSESAPFRAPGGMAESATYAYRPEEPVMVGGYSAGVGPESSRLYLNSLRGPKGEAVTYERRGSCCPFETPSSELGVGLLDVYLLTYDGLPEPLMVYVNMYDRAETYVPRGLSTRLPAVE